MRLFTNKKTCEKKDLRKKISHKLYYLFLFKNKFFFSFSLSIFCNLKNILSYLTQNTWQEVTIKPAGKFLGTNLRLKNTFFFDLPENWILILANWKKACT